MLAAITAIIVLAAGVYLWSWLADAPRSDGIDQTPPHAVAGGDGVSLVPITATAPTLVVVSDYACPHCASAHATLSSVLDEAAEQGKANVVYRTRTTVSPSSRSAAIAAACADIAGAYKDFSDALYERQSPMGFTTRELRGTIPSSAGITGEALSAYLTCFDGQETGRFVDATQRATERYGIAGVPGFLLDERDVTLDLWDPVLKEFSADRLRLLLGMS